MNTFEQARANLAFRGYSDEQLLTCVNIADALLARGYPVTAADVLVWIDGEFEHGDSEVVEYAINHYMGKSTVEYYDALSRVIPAVEFHLGLSTNRQIGGVDVSVSYKDHLNPGFSIVNCPYPVRNAGVNFRQGALSLAILVDDLAPGCPHLNITAAQLMAACETRTFQIPDDLHLLAGRLDDYGVEIHQNAYGFCLRRAAPHMTVRATDAMWERHMQHMKGMSMVERERAEKRLLA